MKMYSYVLGGVSFVGILVLILGVEIKGDYYSLTTEEVHRISTRNEIFIDSVELKNFANSSILLHLVNTPEKELISISEQEIYIQPSNLLNRKNRKIFRQNYELLVLHSDAIEIAARVWIILSRKGYENIRILDNSANERARYSFQPDSIAGLK